MTSPLRVGGLTRLGVEHGFGVREMTVPPELKRPRQVHGVAVVSGADCRGADLPEADAITTSVAGEMVGVITADCVPILVSTRDGSSVAAIHAGWRGLAAGVIGSGIDALRHSGPSGQHSLVAAVGPHIGRCCYEVDAPVAEALQNRFHEHLSTALTPSGADSRWMLDLGHLVLEDLKRCGLEADDMFVLSDACTFCDAVRFHSYRRDGPRSGRLFHFIRARRDAADR